MARLTRIHHEGIPVKDLERSRAFYEGVLGLKTLPRPAFGPGVWLADASGVPQIHLIVSQAAVPGDDVRPDPTARHTAFLVEDYDELKQRFERHGVRYTEATNSPARVAQLTAEEFLRRYLQHVPPPGQHRVRYFGWLHPSATARRAIIETLLAVVLVVRAAPDHARPWHLRCPHCQAFALVVIGVIARGARDPP